MKKSFIYLLLIILFSLFGVKALFKPGFYTSHDGNHQVVRLANFHKGLVDGQFPVRWAGRAMDGYGYPLFIFTYRLPFWFGEIGYLIFGNLEEGIKFAFIVSFVLSGITMYWFLSEVFKKKWIGFFGSIIYLWVPYRFLDIFVRAALGEAFCFVFLPLIFLAIYKLGNLSQSQFFNRKHGVLRYDKTGLKSLPVLSSSWGSWKWVLVLTLGLSGMILSHIMTLIIFSLVIFGWFMIWFPFRGSLCDKWNYFISVFLGGVLSLGLTAYYFVPAFWEKQYTGFSGLIGNYYKDHFVTLKQLLYSKWDYGFSMPGIADDKMSFQVGIAQWLILMVSLIVIFGYFLIKFNKLKLVKFWFEKLFVINKEQIKILIFSFLGFLISIILMTKLGDGFFRLTNKIMAVDIPWKYLSVCVFLAASIFGCLLSFVKNKILRVLLIILVLGLVFYGNRNHLRVNKYVSKTDKEYFENFDTSNQYNDYAPKKFIRYRYNPNRTELVVMKDGEAENKIIENNDNKLIFESNVKTEEAKIMPGIIDYPGWKIFMDGQESKVEETQGNMIISLFQGIHKVELRYKEEDLMNFGGIEKSKMISRKSNEVKFETEVLSSSAKIMTRVSYYPGWKLYVDGVEKEVKNKDGKIIVEMLKGKHEVLLKFGDTWWRKMANWMSLLTLLIVIFIVLRIWKKSKK